MFYITICFYSISLFIFFPLSALAEQKYDLSNKYTLKAGLLFSGSAKTVDTNFQLKNTPSQVLNNQPTSEMAYMPNYLSLWSNVKIQNLGSLFARLDYMWDLPIQLGLYQNSQSVRSLLLKDLYFNIPFLTYEFNFWAGIRTFEFTPINLFSLPNPFNQIGLQGVGIETENLQISISANKSKLTTIGSNENNQLIMDDNGNAVKFPETEYILTLFLSGKFLLSEGRLFEPIFAFRYYMGSKSHMQKSNPNNNIYRAKQASSFIAGGVFSRPISDGIAGTTTVWFSSLPSDNPISANTLPANGVYGGSGRVSANTPMNTIGIMDSSEFYYLQECGLLSAIYLTNNTYSSELPVLKSTNDENTLSQDGNSTSNSNDRLSLSLEPLFFMNRNLIGGVDLNLNYTTEKLLPDDANSIVISPLLKWAYDRKLNSEQYLFTSMSYGIYDWKIKKYSNGSRTDKLFTMQFGAKVVF